MTMYLPYSSWLVLGRILSPKLARLQMLKHLKTQTLSESVGSVGEGTATKPDDLSLIPGTHTVEGEN